MSDRGLILAIQRLHDDPGFAGMVMRDPESTLGLYDLDDNEREAIVNSCSGRDQATMRQLAARVGMDWQAPQIYGLGTIPGDEETAGDVMEPLSEGDQPQVSG